MEIMNALIVGHNWGWMIGSAFAKVSFLYKGIEYLPQTLIF